MLGVKGAPHPRDAAAPTPYNPFPGLIARGTAPLIDKLEFLLALSRERHFGRAAEACGVTQPTLSAGVRSLEDQLGVMLVQRGSRFIGFTPEGERVLEWSRRIVADSRAMRQDVAALRQGLTGHLRLGVVPTAVGFVPALTAPLRARHPGLRFTVYSRTSEEILTLIENLEIEAGLSYVDNEPVGRARTVPLYRERYRLLTTADGPLGDRASVTWRDVGEVPLGLLPPDMQNRRIVDRLLRGAGSEPDPILESNSVIVLAAHVRAGGLATVLPERLAATLLVDAEVKSIPITEPEAVHTIGLIVPVREPATAMAAALLTEARRLSEALETAG